MTHVEDKRCRFCNTQEDLVGQKSVCLPCFVAEPLCACGCGNRVKSVEKRRYIGDKLNRFITGHDTATWISESWKDTLVRAKRIGTMNRNRRDPNSSYRKKWRATRAKRNWSLVLRRAYREGRRVPAIANRRFYYHGACFRSSWELVFAMWLDLYSIKWKYEPTVFKTPRCRSYRPDFYLPDFDLYIEIKGINKQGLMSKLRAVCTREDIKLCLLFGRHLRSLRILGDYNFDRTPFLWDEPAKVRRHI